MPAFKKILSISDFYGFSSLFQLTITEYIDILIFDESYLLITRSNFVFDKLLIIFEKKFNDLEIFNISTNDDVNIKKN